MWSYRVGAAAWRIVLMTVTLYTVNMAYGYSSRRARSASSRSFSGIRAPELVGIMSVRYSLIIRAGARTQRFRYAGESPHVGKQYRESYSSPPCVLLRVFNHDADELGGTYCPKSSANGARARLDEISVAMLTVTKSPS